MQEFELLVSTENGSIVTNMEGIKKNLAAGLEEYKHMVFTEESKKEAKDTVASLRKLKKDVNAKKIEVKKHYMAPYEEFETQAKELMSLIDEPINYIDEQIKEFEIKRVEERKSLIRELYDDIMQKHEEVEHFIPLERIYDTKWENATTTKKAINEAILENVTHVEKDLAAIKDMQSEFEDKGIEAYERCLELSDAIYMMNQYEKQKQEILRRQEEQRKAEEEAKQKAEEQVQEAKEEKCETVVKEPAAAEITQEKKIEPTVMYEMKADAFQIAQIEAAMRDYGIAFRRVQ
ncbi:MAG: DUF1351 domain-containing protein [Pseudobutyrivibrio sp.]|nr:DUF1351 domain-containing protein [Pseudobutyrivibrio sp.]